MDGYNFDSVFKGQTEHEEEFDTIFDREEDGDLIDLVSGLHEDVEGVCPELHQTDGSSTPDDIRDELGEDHDTDNAPEGAEGTDADPIADLAMGECGANDEGVPGESEADDFYSKTDAPGIDPGEGPDQNPDPENTDKEFDNISEGFEGAQSFFEGTDEGSADNQNTNSEGDAGKNGDSDQSMTMDDLDNNDSEDSTDNNDSVSESYEGYEEGDGDLVDLVSGQ